MRDTATGPEPEFGARTPGDTAAFVGPVPAELGRTLPAVPSWVKDPAKWVTLSRAERRALERHHRKATRG